MVWCVSRRHHVAAASVYCIWYSSAARCAFAHSYLTLVLSSGFFSFDDDRALAYFAYEVVLLVCYALD